MGIGFMILLPVIFWVFIVMLIIAVSKPKHRRTQSSRGGGARQINIGGMRTKTAGFNRPRQSVRTSGDRPKMREGLFDMKLGKKANQKPKGLSVKSFRNTDFDDYSAKGRKKDFVSGYDKKLSEGGYAARRAADMQYSHTYDGHEPWDKCLPKEKDPWDKDFYA